MELRGTRQEFEKILFRIIDPVKPFFSPEKAGIRLGETAAHFSDKSVYLEGFSRLLWGLAPLWGGGGQAPVFEEIYYEGLRAGTSPESREYWGPCRDYDQKLVEMGAIAFALLYAREKTWDRLNDVEKDNLADWLNQMNASRCYNCNWHFFAVLVNLALKKLGRSYDRERMEKSLCFFESCYVGNGWYTDGVGGDVDYYLPFAIQFYSLVYVDNMQDEDTERCEKYRKRAVMFGKDFLYWISPEGNTVPYGRFMTYRFAQAAFFSMCIVTKTEPVSMPVMKGIVIRHLQYWMKQHIFDHAGLLTIGYCYPSLYMAESYNSPCSPYWALKIFAVLLLPDDDPFWKMEPENLPELKAFRCIPQSRMLIQRRSDGNVLLFPAGRTSGGGHTHTDAKYNKFVYSSKTGFCVPVSVSNIMEAAPDSVLSFEISGYIFPRGKCRSSRVTQHKTISEWSPFEGISVYSEIVPDQKGHRRIHIVDSAFTCTAYDTGFAIPVGSDTVCTVQTRRGKGEVYDICAAPNTNLVCNKVHIPCIKYRIKKGRNILETIVLYE